MRIRNIKPDFFRHGVLQDLELQHPGRYVMLTFAGLWGLCDRNGVFPAEARRVKLDVLPYLPFDMEETLNILEESGFISRFSCPSGKLWGWVINFPKHQRLSGKEVQSESNYPKPPLKAAAKQAVSASEAPVKHPGAQEEGEEEERKREGVSRAREEAAEDFSDSPPNSAPPPRPEEVALEMVNYFTGDAAGHAAWEFMEQAAGGVKVPPESVCIPWAMKASPYQLSRWRQNTGKLVTWIQTEARSVKSRFPARDPTQKKPVAIEKINPNKYEKYVGN